MKRGQPECIAAAEAAVQGQSIRQADPRGHLARVDHTGPPAAAVVHQEEAPGAGTDDRPVCID